MEEYRGKTLWRFCLLVVCLIVLSLYLLLVLCELLPNSLQPVSQAVAEFQGGLIFAFTVLATLLCFHYARALKGEAGLKGM